MGECTLVAIRKGELKAAYFHGEWHIRESSYLEYEKKHHHILKVPESRWNRKKTGMTLREITHTFPIPTMRKKSALLPLLEAMANQSKIKYDDKMWYYYHKKLKI